MVGGPIGGDTAQVNRLDQLFARSRREIEAHTDDLINTETGRYFISEAAHLLAALRLWSLSMYRSDQAVREILKTLDAATLRDVAGQLRGMGGRRGNHGSRCRHRRWRCSTGRRGWRPIPG